MSAITTVLEYILGYIYALFGILFYPPGDFSSIDDLPGNVSSVAYDVLSGLIENIGEDRLIYFMSVQRPILYLAIGIFAFGSIIGLSRRITRI